MTPIEQAKYNAAKAALNYVKNGMVIGLGTGSTANKAIELLAEKVVDEELNIICIATSRKTEELAKSLKLELRTLDEIKKVDITIDGADEVDGNLNLIKGGGGALFREKLIAKISDKKVIIVDNTKVVDNLGENFPVPIEVVPFSVPVVKPFIERLKATVTLRMINEQPFTTDNGNYILDAKFTRIADPKSLEKKLKMVTGIVEIGLFVDLADIVIIGNPQGSITVKRKK